MNTEQDIRARVKSFEDACMELGLNPENLPIVEHLPKKDRLSIIAYYKLTIITRALNEGWEPDWVNYDDPKYWNWIYVANNGETAGFSCVSSDDAPSFTDTFLGSRLCFKTRELAIYAGEQFRDLYFEYIFIDMPKNYKK